MIASTHARVEMILAEVFYGTPLPDKRELVASDDPETVYRKRLETAAREDLTEAGIVFDNVVCTGERLVVDLGVGLALVTFSLR